MTDYIKRSLDIAISIFAIVFFTPIFILIALVIKFRTKDKVIFKQKRMGQNGKEFYIYKFKTLHVFNNKPFRLGKFLRKTFLDELPQFFNIIKADMSLVGPRPEIYEMAKNYDEDQKKRLKVKPGLTGLWQLSPYIDKPIHEHLEYDFYYIAHQSLWLDLIILSKTVILSLRNIYSSILNLTIDYGVKKNTE